MEIAKKQTITVLLAMFIFCTSSLFGQVAEIKISKSFYGYTLKQALNDISNTYKVDIDYHAADLGNGIIPGRSYYNSSLVTVLSDLLEPQGLQFRIENERIIIRKTLDEIIMIQNSYPSISDFTLKGMVVDKSTNETLPFAQIIVKGTTNGTVSNVDGYFTLFHVPNDSSVLEVYYVGYELTRVKLNRRTANEGITLELWPESKEIEEVVIVEEREDLLELSEKVSMVSMTPREMANLPSLGERDIFRSFQLLPGISGSNESSSGLYVRGGTPDQNLILYDGFTVYHQEHLFGMYSAFNSNAIKDVQLYKGGFGSKYGGRLSSVMEIISKNGNEKEFNVGGDLSLLSFNGFAEGPIGENATFFFAGRKSYQGGLYDKLFDSFQEENEPVQMPAGVGGGPGGRFREETQPSSYFYDLNTKLSYRINSKDYLSLSYFSGQDNLDNSRDIGRSNGPISISGGVVDLTEWGNRGGSLKWSRRWNDKLYTNNLVSFSNYFSIRERSMQRVSFSDDGESSFNNGSYEDNDLYDFSFKTDNEFKQNSKITYNFGVHSTYYDINYNYQVNDTSSLLDIESTGSVVSVYTERVSNRFKNLTLTNGIRATYYDVTDKVYFEGRANLQYTFKDYFKLKAAIGNYYQFTNRIIREDVMTGSRDFWVLSNDQQIPVSKSTHYIGGISWGNADYIFDIEAYYKKLEGLAEYTLRFAPSYGRELNYDEFFYQGDGFSRGIEFLFQKKYGDFTGWLGYTLGEVMHRFDDFQDGYYPATHDVTHELKAVASYEWNKWTFSGTWIYATGKPYTEPIGGYSIGLLDGETVDFVTIGPKNGSRYPDYHRLDLSARYNFNLGLRSKGSLSFSLFNAYNRENVWYKEFEIDETGLTETNVNLLGITPNITLSIQLK